MSNDLDITDSVLAELRSAADIVEVIGEHTRLKKAGRSWKGLCPFHNERTPSFTVDRDKGLYHCFGCGAGGDVIHFVRQMDRLEFPEAVEALAGRFGVVIPRRTRGPRDDRREKLLEAAAAAQRFYAAELAKPASRAAAYLTERGVAPELTHRLGLGHAPDSWDSLSRALSAAYPESLLVESGLLQPGQDGKRAYDRFRDRLLFVIRDERGRPVGFGGRALSPANEPKYLNSPESPIFQKKRTLYGLSEARDAMRRRERVVLVEGYFDHLALVSAGIEETVASMGTALTPEQCEKLRRLVPRVVLCYDGDSAGRTATRSALALLLAHGMVARVALLPEGSDPHDVLTSEGTESLRTRIDQSVAYLDFLIADVKPGDPNIDSTERSGRVAQILDVIRSIPDRITRHGECMNLASQIGIPFEVLWQKVRPPEMPSKKVEATPDLGTLGNPALLTQSEPQGWERMLLRVVLQDSEYKQFIFKTLDETFLQNSRAREVYVALRTKALASGPVDFHRQIADLTEENGQLCRGLAASDDPLPTEKGVSDLISQLQIQHLSRKWTELQRQMELSKSQGSDQTELIVKTNEISQQIARLKAGLGSKGKHVGN
jgi:DNA primase